MLFVSIAQRTAVDLPEPENEAAEVGVTPEEARVLGEDKGAIVFAVDQGPIVNRVRLNVVVSEPIDNRPATTVRAVVEVNQIGPLAAQIYPQIVLNGRQHRVDELTCSGE